ncbi:MAG: hypothetical protein ACRDRT_11795 [Pseudonocardiaceae bacterium]
MKGVGEPGAGEPHARFDGGELEKELLRQPIMAALGKPRDLSPASPTAATSPAPYPTNMGQVSSVTSTGLPADNHTFTYTKLNHLGTDNGAAYG